MPDHQSRDNQSENVDHDSIARAVFAAAESMGISDRDQTEELIELVIQRLERQEAGLPFPGMEDAVTKKKGKGKRGVETPEIKGIVKEALAEIGRHQVAVASPEPKEEKPLPVVVRREEERDGNGEAKVMLSANALRVLEKRYLRKDSEGQVIEKPQELFRRVAHSIAAAELAFNPQAEIESWEERFYALMTNLEFLPNSPTLMNAGRELGQLSACFVLPIEDSMESIFEAIKQTALIHKSGGGTGFSFSRLRPEKDRVGSTGGVASGPLSFMRAFDAATDVIKQGGMRRGANMAILNIDHPDILNFITAKVNSTTLSNFNLSVAITEDFMKAVEKGSTYDLVNPRTGKTVDSLNASEVFDKMVDLAWGTGDPGIIFLDRINKDNPTPNLGKIESTNPCGEQPLLPYESCNLGSINLSKMLHKRKGKGKGKVKLDHDRLAQTVRTVVRFLDNVIEANKFPTPQIQEKTRATRKIGLGIMGFADMLLQLKIPYDSNEALEIAENVMKVVLDEATKASVELAQERGVFPAFEGSIYDVPGGTRVRNASRTTIAPTGTLSIIANCSSGIEPLFALSYVRNILDGEQLVEVNPYFEEVAREEGFYSEELMRELSTRGSVRGIEGVPEWVQQVFVTAHDITPEWHVRMQAAFQKSTNNAVSKTVNFPHDATREDIAQVFMLAYQLGCKGITIYRDGSKDSQVLSVNKEKPVAEIETETKAKTEALAPRGRTRITTGLTERVNTGCGHIYVTVNRDETGICEVFSTLGKSGGCASAQLEAISRLISLSLRSGLDINSILKQLRGIRCPSIAWDQGHAVLSCPDAICSVLSKELSADNPNGKPAEKAEKKTEAPTATVNPSPCSQIMGNLSMCPECGDQVIFQEGCCLCPSCGYTKCG